MRRFLINVALASLTALILTCGVESAAAQAGQSRTGGTGSMVAEHTPVPGRGIYRTMPHRPAGLARPDEARKRIEVPFDSALIGVDIAPEDPPLEAGPEPGSLSKSQDLQAAGDFIQFRNTNIDPDSAAAAGRFTQTSDVDEPSLAMNGRVVFYTGNWFAGVSGDGGQSFRYLDPFDNLPVDGSLDTPPNSGAFCCDQVVQYEPSRGLMIWVAQYSKSGENPLVDSNVTRLVVANSQEDVLNNNWFWWNLDPTDFGLPSVGVWFDFPDIAFTEEYLYFTTNVFNIVAPNPPTDPTGKDTYNTTVIARFPLDEIADGGNTSWRYWNRSVGTIRPVQGAASTMYLGAQVDNNTVRVYEVADNSITLSSHDIDHAGFNTLSGQNDVMTAPCSDGTDMAQRAGTRILGAWYSPTSDEVGLMWNADESDGAGDVSTSYPYPYVRILRIDASTWAVNQQRSIYNTNYAWMYPSVAVNDRGHIGGTMASGCGTTATWPRASAWIVDDYNTTPFPSLSDLEVSTFATSNDGPNGNQWGDYLTTRRNFPYENSWVGSGFRLTGGGNPGDVVPEFIWFGRERDTPPATNVIYVDKTYTAGYEVGTLSKPYNTVDEGSVALQPGDLLRIEQNTYGENPLFNTQANVENRNGVVVIQGPTASGIAPADRVDAGAADEVSDSESTRRPGREPASEEERKAAEEKPRE
ncbi:MAG: hypothetical protein WBW88_11925 [Rhodothermales bacterium]